MKVLRLRSQETLSGRKEFIVLGATTVCGEDVTCRGKVGEVVNSYVSNGWFTSFFFFFLFLFFFQILIFDVTEVIPEPGKPLTKHKLKVKNYHMCILPDLLPLLPPPPSSPSFLPLLSSPPPQCLYNQEQKGPISALEAVEGLLLSCMGQKVSDPW